MYNNMIYNGDLYNFEKLLYNPNELQKLYPRFSLNDIPCPCSPPTETISVFEYIQKLVGYIADNYGYSYNSIVNSAIMLLPVGMILNPKKLEISGANAAYHFINSIELSVQAKSRATYISRLIRYSNFKDSNLSINKNDITNFLYKMGKQYYYSILVFMRGRCVIQKDYTALNILDNIMKSIFNLPQGGIFFKEDLVLKITDLNPKPTNTFWTRKIAPFFIQSINDHYSPNTKPALLKAYTKWTKFRQDPTIGCTCDSFLAKVHHINL